MRLTAFRIRNFRSIVDTGWQNLSPDNITCLIGQNESGKTSILEALRVFHTGTISEDVLRSDLSLPEVSCRFSIPEGWLLTIVPNPGEELTRLMEHCSSLDLTRRWLQDFTTVTRIEGEISQYLDSLGDTWKQYLAGKTALIENELLQLGQAEEKLAQLAEEEGALRASIQAAGPHGFSLSMFRKKKTGTTGEMPGSVPEMKERLGKVREEKESLAKALTEKQVVKKACDKWQKVTGKYIALGKQIEDLQSGIGERHQQMTLLFRAPEDDMEWKNLIGEYRKTRSEHEQKRIEADRQTAAAGFIIEGDDEQAAELRAGKAVSAFNSQYSSESLGKICFDNCPVFELFEDFGSLLPNRIDLDDIISGNEKVEGFKAAKNFLTIAGLDHSFFQQQSSRILKQKIENLNNTLTRNFHDFWQQSIGTNNKIHIQFELEHYNASFGQRAGKPYLEFWIKDEGERLYPKQRSRGVRWFLSFYMELKASAMNSDRQLILLVDEPGVSLHARAQEDVLKVFDDIRERIQVVYTTHSPHLVEVTKLHRVLAVQRDDLDSMKSNTRIIDPLRLSDASPDTLTPLQGILGNPLAGEGFNPGMVNLIVNDIGSYYMLKAVMLLTGFRENISVIPSTNVESIPLLCNILMGWGMDFAMLVFDNEEEIEIAEMLANTVYSPETDKGEFIVRVPQGFNNSEDLLSTLDFKNFILNSREGITVPNSIYIIEKALPRNFMLSRFLNSVKEGKIKPEDLDEESNENFRLITDLLRDLK